MAARTEEEFGWHYFNACPLSPDELNQALRKLKVSPPSRVSASAQLDFAVIEPHSPIPGLFLIPEKHLTNYAPALNMLMYRLGVTRRHMWYEVIDFNLMINPNSILAITAVFKAKQDTVDFGNLTETEALNKRKFVSPLVFFMKQVSRRTGPTVALLNTIFNLLEHTVVVCNSHIARFYLKIVDLDPFERGVYLDSGGSAPTSEESEKFECEWKDKITFRDVMKQDLGKIFSQKQEKSESSKKESPKEIPTPKYTPLSKKMGFQFMTYICVEECLYELNGLRSVPIMLGKIKEGKIAQRALQRILMYTGKCDICRNDVKVYALVDS